MGTAHYQHLALMAYLRLREYWGVKCYEAGILSKHSVEINSSVVRHGELRRFMLYVGREAMQVCNIMALF